MSKKRSSADIGKLVEAQAKGKKLKKAPTESRKRSTGELDTRESKYHTVKAG